MIIFVIGRLLVSSDFWDSDFFVQVPQPTITHIKYHLLDIIIIILFWFYNPIQHSQNELPLFVRIRINRNNIDRKTGQGITR